MVATNYLWMASYLHEMLGSYVEESTDTGTGSLLYKETLLAAHIVELGIHLGTVFGWAVCGSGRRKERCGIW